MTNILKKLDLLDGYTGAGNGNWLTCDGSLLESISPVDGRTVGKLQSAGRKNYEQIVVQSMEAFNTWRMIPAPKRGEVVRQIGNALREHKEYLGTLVSLETGKILQEGIGEVQEMIDIADFAVGQSRMLYGKTMHSERSGHRMYEQWHPIGPVGVITAFNFPVAVWSWNAMIALICGNSLIWKPSSKAFISAIAVMKIIWPILKDNNLPEGLLNIIIGSRDEIGKALIQDPRVPLISATGSVHMGQNIAKEVASRLGKTILELGGNNAIIVTPSADLDLVVRAVVFGAIGTAGQRCTTTRRVIVHKSIYKNFKNSLIKAYKQVRIGSPLEGKTLMGPLIDRGAVRNMLSVLKKVKHQGGKIVYGGEILEGGLFDIGTYVLPCICEVSPDCPIIKKETFAPVLYLLSYETLDEAILYHNSVPQGLSSAIFTNDLKESETFLSYKGSDCGIANVNIGTSGAEIGGAFGGEKDTGGGREAGSDAWKAYMRRQTITINWSGGLPLAQGIHFNIR